MIAMGVAMGDDEFDWALGMTRAPRLHHAVDRRRDIDAPGASIEQERATRPEDEIEKRFFVVRARGLSQNVEVCVVGMHQHRRSSGALRTTGIHAGRHDTGFETRTACAADIRRGRVGTARARGQQRERSKETCFGDMSRLVV